MDIKLGCVKKERESTGKEQATPLLGGKSEKKRVTKMERKKSLRRIKEQVEKEIRALEEVARRGGEEERQRVCHTNEVGL